MANAILILGPSGGGKSHSIKNLDHNKTMLVNVYGKSLPFPGWKRKYVKKKGGNMAVTDQVESVIKSIDYGVNSGKKIVVVDDYQFIAGLKMIREALKRSGNPYDKFTKIAQGFIEISDHVKKLPDDVVVFFLSHIEDDGFGGTKAKTAGKMVDNVIGLESLFTVVLQTEISEGKYSFVTQNPGNTTVKSPVGMFDSKNVPNDLDFVYKSIVAFEDGEEAPIIEDENEGNPMDLNAADSGVSFIPDLKDSSKGINFGKINTSLNNVPEDPLRKSDAKSLTQQMKDFPLEPSQIGVPSVDIDSPEIEPDPPVDNVDMPLKEAPPLDPPSDKAIEIAEALGGWVSAQAFLRKKKSLGADESLRDLEDDRINRLYNNRDKLRIIMDKESK